MSVEFAGMEVMRTGRKFILVTENGHYGLIRNCNDLFEVYSDPALWSELRILRVCGSRSEANGYARRAMVRLGFALYPRDITGLTVDPRTKRGCRMSAGLSSG